MGLNNKSEGEAIYMDWTCGKCETVNATVVNDGYSFKYVIPTYNIPNAFSETSAKPNITLKGTH